MKALLKILLGGLGFFIAVAIVQEREYFSAAWFGKSPGTPPALGAAQSAPAQDVVRQYLSLLRHLYATGDARFAERLPASQQVVEEVLAEVAYLRRNQRVQDSVLIRMEPLQTLGVGEGQYEVKTKEYWVIRSLQAGSGAQLEPPRSEVAYRRYMVTQEGTGLKVYAWDIDEAPPDEPGER